MKQFLSSLVFIAAMICGISTTVMAQVPSVVAAPIPPTCQGTNTTLHYSATNSPNSYSITWFGSPAGLPNVAPGTFLPPTTIPITVLSSCVPGTYFGTLVISNVAGGSNPVGINVTVYGLPNVYSVTGGGSYCFGTGGLPIGLSGSENGVQYQLLYGGGFSGSSVWGSGASVTFGSRTLAGAYTVVGTNAYTGCVSNMSGSANITINPMPTVVNVTGGGGYCAGGSGVNIGLSASVFGTYYQLYNGSTPVGGALPGIGMSLDFGPQTTIGSYTVMAIDSTGPCSAQMNGTVPVYIYPEPMIYNVTGGGSYCYGGYGVDVQLSGSNSGIIYKLYNNSTVLMGTLTGNGSALDFGLQIPDGIYTVKATNSVYGCTLPMADTAIIAYIPDTTPTVSIATHTIVCTGTIDTFRAVTVNGGSAPQYQWDLNGAFVAYGDTYIYTPNNGDVVKVTLTSNVTCAVPSVVVSSLNVNVKSDLIPAVVLDAAPGNTIINGTTENLSVAILSGAGVSPVYQWLVNGVIVAGANTADFSTNAFKNGDSVTCLVYGCSDTPGVASTIIHVIPKEGVTQLSTGNNNVQIIPNPSNGVFTLTGDIDGGNTTNASIIITDMLGKIIYRDNVSVSNGKINTKIQMPSPIPAGMYMLNLHSENSNIISKIVIE